MFKIKINDLNRFNFKGKIAEPYEIKFELQPEFSNSLKQTIYYQTCFSSNREALQYVKKLSKFLEDCFYFTDLIYYRITALGVYNHTLKIDNKSFIDYCKKVQNARLSILTLNFPAYAYQIIDAINSYINSLLGIIIFYAQTFPKESEIIFELLQNFKEYFKTNYRASRELFNENNLKILW